MNHYSGGWIEMICGPMFSGKTEELLRRIKRAQIAKQRVQVFKPILDDRYSEDHVQSHDSSRAACFTVRHAHEIYDRLGDTTKVVGIDEIQFLDESIVTIAEKLAYRGVRVIAAGLDLDYKGQPFGVVPNLLAVAETVSKLTAICTVCGMEATRSQRLLQSHEVEVRYSDNNSNEDSGEGRGKDCDKGSIHKNGKTGKKQSPIAVGGKESYEPRCRAHHEKEPEAVNLSFPMGAI